MEVLSILEKKIAHLVEYVGKLKADNGALLKDLELAKADCELLKQEYDKALGLLASQEEEMALLKCTIEDLKNADISNKECVNEFTQEKELAKVLVDDLISSIDLLVEERQS